MKRCSRSKAFQAWRWLQEKICTENLSCREAVRDRNFSCKEAVRDHGISYRPHRTGAYSFSRIAGADCGGSPAWRAGSPTFSSSGFHGLKAFCGRRFFYTDSRGWQHFERRGFSSNRWSTRQIVVVSVAGTGLCATIYFSKREVVPYTYRKHFVLISPDLEMQLVDSQFQALKEEWKHVILPSYHPQTIRVQRISRDIVKSVLEGVQLEESPAKELDTEQHAPSIKDDSDVVVWHNDPSFSIPSEMGDKEEKFDEQWMNETRKKALRTGVKPYIEHLKKMKWEVLVVDKDMVNAFCLPGGKIVVFTGLLKRFPSDEEIATVLGHEVAHVVARHSAERMSRHLFITLIQLMILAFLYAPDLVQSMSALFLELPFSRNQELEADHIGLLIMAAAGYDPRVAPTVYEKLGELTKHSELLQYVTTHPSGKKRGERLRKTGTMEEALTIYAQKTEGTAVEGFLRSI